MGRIVLAPLGKRLIICEPKINEGPTHLPPLRSVALDLKCMKKEDESIYLFVLEGNQDGSTDSG